MTSSVMPLFFAKYADLTGALEKFHDDESQFVVNTYWIASHTTALTVYIQGIDEAIAENGFMSAEEFEEHWQYSEMVLRGIKPILDYIHPRKLKEGYLPLDQEVLTFVRKACVLIGGFRTEVLRRWNKQTSAQKLASKPLQERLNGWMVETIGKTQALDKDARDAELIQNMIALVKSRDIPKEQVIEALVLSYTDPVKELAESLADTFHSLLSFATANQIDLNAIGEDLYQQKISNSTT